jgi:hypothetical protein
MSNFSSLGSKTETETENVEDDEQNDEMVLAKPG